MICQMCLQAQATMHLFDRASGDRLVESHYCAACYDLKYADPPARPPAFPRPRFRIKDLMILAGVFAVPNAAIVLIMRSGLVPGTPAQVRDWTMKAFLAFNLGFGILWAYMLLVRWLAAVRSHKMTGGLVPMPAWRTPPPRMFLRRLLTQLGPMFVWLIAAAFLMRWLIRTFWSNRRPNIPAIFLMNAILLLLPTLVWTFLIIRSNRALVERIRAVWGGASRGERACTILVGLWPLVMMTLPLIPWIRTLPLSNPWLAGCVILFIGLGVPLLLFLGAVASTRRR